MRNRILIALVVAVLIALAFVFDTQRVKKFKWEPTFDQHDKQPFGCYVFDDVAKSSLPKGYSVVNKTFYQLAEDSTLRRERKAYLCISTNLYSRLVLEKQPEVRQLLERGNKIMLVTDMMRYFGDRKKVIYFNYALTEDIDLSTLPSLFTSPEDLKRDTLTLADGSRHTCLPQILGSNMNVDDRSSDDSINIDFSETDEFPNEYFNFADTLSYTVLARDAKDRPIALKINVGKGELYIVSNPLLFTNYGVLDGNNAGFAFGLLRHIADLPVVRTEAYGGATPLTLDEMQKQSFMRYIFSQPPLRWAYLLSILLVLLFMFFTARRRQRAIPVITPPQNKALEFIRLIGTLYYQRKDYTDLTRKKITYFYEQIKQKTHIDIEAEELTPELSERLSGKTGMDAQRFYQLLVELQGIQASANISLTDEQMKSYIDRMNEILNNL